MAIEIEETFRIAVPVETAWQFLLDPHRIVTCMPGAALETVVDARTFDGTVKIRLGAITTRYHGRVRLTDVDDRKHRVCMRAEGRETGGGTAKGSLTSELRALPDGDTEVLTSARIEVTGRAMQVGSRLIQGVSSQLFGEFVDRTRRALETPAPDGEEPSPPRDDAIPVLRTVLGVVRATVARLLRRIFGRRRA